VLNARFEDVQTAPPLNARARDDLLSRDQVAERLTAAGYRIKEKTLATKASRGGGPPYHIFNGRALYHWGDALDWARQGMKSPPRLVSYEPRS
jgi:hypothetical protein